MKPMEIASGRSMYDWAYRIDHAASGEIPKNLVEEPAATVAAASSNDKPAKYDFKTRLKMAKSGTAMKDGSYPIADEEDLHNAVQAFGRAKNPDAAKRHIIKRARALKKVSALPESWGIKE
jgi:hypothetical protein